MFSINLSYNKIKTFPWRSLLWLNVKKLLLDFNNIIEPPHRLSELQRINRMDLFDISSNPIQCSCALQKFANWITKQNKSLPCRTALNWIRMSTTQISNFDLSLCEKPTVEMLLLFSSEPEPDYLPNQTNSQPSEVVQFVDLFQINTSTITMNIKEGVNTTIRCSFASNATPGDHIVKIGWKNSNSMFCN